MSMEKHMQGYLIEVSDKTDISGECMIIRNLKKVIVSSYKFIELLKEESAYTVWSAQLIDIEEYKKSNAKTEEWL